MSTKAIFEYRHKKFDQRKRSRDEDTLSTESLEATFTNLTNSTPKRRKIHSSATAYVNGIQNQFQSSSPSVFVPASRNVYQSMVQLMNFDNQMPSLNRPRTTLMFPMNGTIFTAHNRIRIKSEPIDFSIPSQHSPPSEIQTQPITTEEIKTEHLLVHQIKQELMDLENSHNTVPLIPKEIYEDICKYRSNMARNFPRKERSSKEQERRVKNTFACRKSRRIEKIQQVATEEEYKCYKQTNLQMEEYAIRAAVYFRELMKLSEKVPDTNDN
ncbi:uncharacterized protein LOC129948007 [Eupeodes corollae]|uniref:uncharacterized protein LOC129948007 n=1 Tax=Eupeodes corollae TaxID=290404 RepID=UPI0024901678|nr:uncharacterized protein LOC129948007 [Eupeodes corollae]